MTFLQQQSKLSRLLGDANVSSSDQWPSADRMVELNRGELQFARDSKSLLGYTTGTVASQAITVPSDWLETYVLTVTEGGLDIVLTSDREVSIQDWERYQNSGYHYYYYWVDSSGVRKLNFVDSATDGETYKLWYFRKPTTSLSADADESVHTDEYREASVYYAASELLEQVGKTENAAQYRLKYQYFVDKAKNETEMHYINKQYPRPDILGERVFDKDVQGIGTVY